MTTARDLLITTLDGACDHEVEQGDLSLALAGAELVDLIDAEAVTLDGDHIVPGLRPTLYDRLLNGAASSLILQAPYESVEDWLWRRGRGLAAAYLAAMEAEGEVTLRLRSWFPLQADPTALCDSPDRRRAAERWSTGEPVLAALAVAVGILDEPTEDIKGLNDEAVVTVLAAVNDAVMELEAARQRRGIEEGAFDNVWRGY
jgi:hypothetical protein